MTRKAIFGLALGALMIVAAAQPADAACTVNRTFASLNTVTGYYSYVLADADWEKYYGGDPVGSDIGTTVSSALSGTFWHLGNGDPALMAGNDNGAYAPLYGWIYTSIGYNSALNGDWAGTSDIDGCIDAPAGGPADRCMAIFLQDVDSDGAVVHALLTAPANPNGNYEFDQAGGADIIFAPLPALGISGSEDTGDTSVSVTTVGPTIETLCGGGGCYLSSEGECGAKADIIPITGYKNLECILPEGSPPPAPTDPCWVDVDGVEYSVPVSGEGTSSVANVTCAGGETTAQDVYMSYRLVLDGGFEVALGAGGTQETQPPRVACGKTLAVDPQDRIRIRKDGLRQRPTTRR